MHKHPGSSEYISNWKKTLFHFLNEKYTFQKGRIQGMKKTATRSKKGLQALREIKRI